MTAWEWPLICLSGLLGSAHCIGMCGPFALTLGLGSAGVSANAGRQLLYSLGRITTYAVLGAAAGYAGWRVSRQFSSLAILQAGLSIAAGLFLLYEGLRTAGLWPVRRRGGGQAACLGSSALRTFLTSPRRVDVFLAGLFTGLLPCGLVYAFLALAMNTRSVWPGMAVMAAFGAGTVPAMMLTGVGAALVSWSARRRLLRIAACCVVVTGLLTLARGFAALHSAPGEPSPRCPMCAPNASVAVTPVPPAPVPLAETRTSPDTGGPSPDC